MKFSIIIPTMYFNIELESMLEVYSELEQVQEILVVNNSKTNYIPFTHIPKVREIGNGENIFVNPAWKLGVQEAKTQYVVLANDDLKIKQPLEPLFNLVSSTLKENMVIGVGENCFSESGELKIQKSKSLNYGFGTFMFIGKETFLETPIPKEIKVWYGDTLIHYYNESFTFSGIKITTKMRGTSSRLNLRGVNKKERELCAKQIKRLPTRFPKNNTNILNVVVALKKSREFGVKDVFLLAKNIKKHTKTKINILCMLSGIEKEYIFNDVRFIPVHTNWDRWWIKMNIFSPEMEKERPFLYVDLDTAILGDLKEFVECVNENNFVTLEDFYRKNVLASGLMWIPKNSVKISNIWNKWIANPAANISRYRGDQDFIGAVVKSDNFWQTLTPRIGTFKPRRKGYVTNTNGYDVVCFHGRPKIWEAASTIHWVKEYCYE